MSQPKTGKTNNKKELLVHSITADSLLIFFVDDTLSTLFILYFLLTNPIYTKINKIAILIYKCMYTN